MADSIPKPLKCMIKNLDTGDEVEAHFNPKELAIEKSVPWNKHKDSKGDTPLLEFTDAEPKTMSVELLFDTYESRKSVYKKYIKTLEEFTLIVDQKKKRPPMCIFLWGKSFPSFMGVIESLATKYTMFLADGTPVRATVTVKMKQADKLIKGEKEGEGDKKNKSKEKEVDYTAEGRTARENERRRADLFGSNHRQVLDSNGSETGELDGVVQEGD